MCCRSEHWKSTFNKHSTGQLGSDRFGKPWMKRFKFLSAVNCTILRLSGSVVFQVLQSLKDFRKSPWQTPSRGVKKDRHTTEEHRTPEPLSHPNQNTYTFIHWGLCKLFSFEGRLSLFGGGRGQERSLYILYLLAGANVKGLKWELRKKMLYYHTTEILT